MDIVSLFQRFQGAGKKSVHTWSRKGKENKQTTDKNYFDGVRRPSYASWLTSSAVLNHGSWLCANPPACQPGHCFEWPWSLGSVPVGKAEGGRRCLFPAWVHPRSGPGGGWHPQPAAGPTFRLHSSLPRLQNLEEMLLPLESSAILTDQPRPLAVFAIFSAV